MVCQVAGCAAKHYGTGLCFSHWRRLRRTGTTDSPAPRPCIGCGRSFLPALRQPHAATCSVKCRNSVEYAKRKAAAPSKACERCGTMFTPLLPATRFCTRECGAANSIVVRTREKSCADCGGTFVTSGRHRTCPSCSRERMLVRVRARNKVRRYLRRGAAGPTHSLKDWVRLVARYRGLCAYCGASKATCRDHVIPIARGGKDSIGNILPACSPCNLSKGRSLLVEWKNRTKKHDRRTKAKTNKPPPD